MILCHAFRKNLIRCVIFLATFTLIFPAFQGPRQLQNGLFRSAMADSDTSCRLTPLPEDVEVHVVEAPKWFLKTLAYFDDQPTIAREVEIVVSQTRAPVVLALSSLRDTVWTIGLTPGGRLAGVVLGSSRRHGLAGIDENTPVLDTGLREWRHCPSMSFQLTTHEGQRQKAYETIEKITGRDIAYKHSKEEGPRIVVGEPVAESTEINFADTSIGFEPYTPGAEDFGREGLSRLIDAGILRRAERADLEAWLATAGEPIASEATSLSRVPLDQIYVVLGPVTLPDGLIGSRAVTFLVADGAPPPSGPMGDNFFYSMVNFTCHPRCGL